MKWHGLQEFIKRYSQEVLNQKVSMRRLIEGVQISRPRIGGITSVKDFEIGQVVRRLNPYRFYKGLFCDEKDIQGYI